ncbi:MAG: O-antigen ligase family protein, partial [Anaerolineales bacterium]|nr:O-antigen ligase family protein [Anaerolineales bacterium]
MKPNHSPTPHSPLSSLSSLLPPHSSSLWLLLALILLTFAQENNQGPLAWGALPLNLPWRIGPLALLPLLPAVNLMQQWRSQAWTWGDWRVSTALVVLTAVSIPAILHTQQWASAISLALCWLIYLSLVNVPRDKAIRPLFWLLCLVILIQGSVGIAQFIYQHDLGLTWFGEPALNPQQPGISVVYHQGERWLRAYGLNSHPNRLGLKLTMLLLMLWPYRQPSAMRHHKQRLAAILFWTTLLIGLGGLLTSLSRSAWLALAAGGGIYGLSWLRQKGWRQRPLLPTDLRITILILIIGLSLFAFFYGDTVSGRVARLDTPLESRSLAERSRDSDLAWQLFQAELWRGVGLGEFVPAAKTLDPFAGVVHHVALLMAAEMGIPGLLGWL